MRKFFQGLSGGSSYTTYTDYSLVPETGLANDQECIVTSINGTPSKALMKVVNGVWVPQISGSQLSYVAGHPKPQLAKTIPGPWMIDGCTPDAYGSPSIGGMLANWGHGTATSATTCLQVVNVSGQPVNRVKLAMMSADSNCAALSAKVKIGNDMLSSSGTWVNAAFSGQPSITLNGADTGAVMAWSDWLILPSEMNPGDTMTVWLTAVGSDSTQIMPLTSAFNYQSWKEATNSAMGRISVGDGVGGETMDWIFAGMVIGLSKIAWGHTSQSQGIVNIAAFGDSTISMYNGVGAFADYSANGYQGWAYSANKLAIAQNKNYRVSSYGRGSMTIQQYKDIALAAIPGLVGTTDIVAFQPWSGNSPTNPTTLANHIAITAQVKAACDAAGISFMPFTISLTAGGTWTGSAWTESLSAQEIQSYWDVKAYMAANYPSFVDASSACADGTGNHYNLTDCIDDEHCYSSNSTEQLGQWKFGNMINNIIEAKIRTLGYAI